MEVAVDERRSLAAAGPACTSIARVHAAGHDGPGRRLEILVLVVREKRRIATAAGTGTAWIASIASTSPSRNPSTSFGDHRMRPGSRVMSTAGTSQRSPVGSTRDELGCGDRASVRAAQDPRFVLGQVRLTREPVRPDVAPQDELVPRAAAGRRRSPRGPRSTCPRHAGAPRRCASPARRRRVTHARAAAGKRTPQEQPRPPARGRSRAPAPGSAGGITARTISSPGCPPSRPRPDDPPA